MAAATHRNRRASALLLLALLFARCSASLLVETHAFLEDGGFLLTQTELDLAEHVVELRDLGMRVLGSCDGHELVLGDIARVHVNTSDAMVNVGDLVAIYGDDCADARRDPRYVRVVDVEETHPERRRLQVQPATFDDVFKSGSVHGVLTAPAHMAQGAAELLAAQVLGMPGSEQAFTVVGKPHGPSDGVMRDYVALTLASADTLTGRRRVLLGLEPGDEVLSDVDLAFYKASVANITTRAEAEDALVPLAGEVHASKLLAATLRSLCAHLQQQQQLAKCRQLLAGPLALTSLSETVVRMQQDKNVPATDAAPGDGPRRRLSWWPNPLSAVYNGAKSAASSASRAVSQGIDYTKETVRNAANTAGAAIAAAQELGSAISNGYTVSRNPAASISSANFNYDGSGGAVRPSIPLWSSSASSSRMSATAAASLTCEGCFAYAIPSFNFEITLKVGSLGVYIDQTRVTIALDYGADLALLARATAQASGQGQVPIMRRMFLTTVTLAVGPVPIPISFYAALDATYGFSAQGEASLRVRASIPSSRYEIGFEYSRSGGTRVIRSGGGPRLVVDPPEVNLKASGTVSVALVPMLTVEVWNSWPITAALTATAAVDFSISSGAGSSCGASGGASYQVKGGLTAAVSAEQLTVSLPFLSSASVTIGKPLLPWSTSSDLMPLSPISCAVCRGCLPLPLALTQSGSGSGSGGGGSGGSSGSTAVTAPIAYTYDASSWGYCSLPCAPGGTQSRSVTCVAARGSTRVVVDGSFCASQTIPDSVRTCNSGVACSAVGIAVLPSPLPPGSGNVPTWASLCPVTCTPLLGNGQCEVACNLVGCQFDGGDCLAVNIDPCAARTSCGTCLVPFVDPDKPSCGWCASTGRCASGGRSGPQAGVAFCDASQWVARSCSADEPALVFTSPTAGVLYKVNDAIPIVWRGGQVGGSVSLAWIVGNASSASTFASGFGLPMAPLANSGSFTWTLQAGAPTSSTVRLVVLSSSTTDNFALSPIFQLDGRPQPGYRWLAGVFGACSVVCGGGVTSRVVTCMMRLTAGGSEVAVADSECTSRAAATGAKPGTTASCNTVTCPNVCPAVPACQSCPTCCGVCSCRRQSGGSDEFCGMTYVHPVTGMSTTLGCDTRDSTYQHCCQQRGQLCDDGCTNVARWIETYTAGCSVTCGGGTQYRQFTCRGQYSRYSTATTNCFDQFCRGVDPTGNYRCNTQPCETFSWSAGEWGPCSRQCAGLGLQTRVVLCRSSANVTVADGQCSGPRPDVQQVCNTRECRFTSLMVLSPSLGQAVAYGSPINVSWTGGMEEGLIVLEIAAASTGALEAVGSLGTSGAVLSDPRVAALRWISAEASLGTVYNSLWWIWTPPATFPSGAYLMRLSNGTSGSNSTLSQPFMLRGATNFTISLPFVSVDGAGSANIGACLSFGLAYSGSYGLTSQPALVPASITGGSFTAGSVSFSFVAPDPGTVLSASLLAHWQSSPACRTGASISTQAAILRTAGTFAVEQTATAFETRTSLANAASPTAPLVVGLNSISLSACSSYDGSCSTCTQQLGCVWCANATGLARGEVGACRPLQGSATCEDLWARNVTDASQVPANGPGNQYSAPAMCPDRCAMVTSCFDCAMSIGCGFCAATGACLAGNQTRPQWHSCAAGWTVNANTCPSPPPSPSVSAHPLSATSSATATPSMSVSEASTGSISRSKSANATVSGTSLPTASTSGSATVTPGAPASASGSATVTPGAPASASGSSNVSVTRSPVRTIVPLSITLPGVLYAPALARGPASLAAAERLWCALRSACANAARVPIPAVAVTALRIGANGNLLRVPQLVCARRLSAGSHAAPADWRVLQEALTLTPITAFLSVSGINASNIIDGLLELFSQAPVLDVSMASTAQASCAAFNISTAECPPPSLSMRLAILSSPVDAAPDESTHEAQAAASQSTPGAMPVAAGASAAAGVLIVIVAVASHFLQRKVASTSKISLETTSSALTSPHARMKALLAPSHPAQQSGPLVDVHANHSFIVANPLAARKSRVVDVVLK